MGIFDGIIINGEPINGGPRRGGGMFDGIMINGEPINGEPIKGESVKQNTSLAGDLVTDLKIGTQGIPGAITGLGDIAAGAIGLNRPFDRATDYLGEKTGFQPAKWAKTAEQEYSPDRQAANADINRAWDEGGAGNIAGAYASHPSATLGNIVKSVPALAVGGVAGRAVAGVAKLAPYIAGGVGEGVVSAGMAMDQTDRAVDPQRAALTSAATGAITTAIGVGSGKVANALGIGDINTSMAGGVARRTERDAINEAKRMPWYKRIPASMAQEGLLEELPQSMSEQAMQNYAEEKPIGEGVARAGVEGALAGMGMGGGFNAYGAARDASQVRGIRRGLVRDGYATPDAKPVDMLDAMRDRDYDTWLHSGENTPADAASINGLIDDPASAPGITMGSGISVDMLNAGTDRDKAAVKERTARVKESKSAFNEGSGVFAVDPDTQLERELTNGEWLEVQDLNRQRMNPTGYGSVAEQRAEQNTTAKQDTAEANIDDIPLPADVGSAVGVLELANKEQTGTNKVAPRALVAGSPLHAAVLEANRILEENGLTYRPTPASKPGEKRVKKATQAKQAKAQGQEQPAAITAADEALRQSTEPTINTEQALAAQATARMGAPVVSQTPGTAVSQAAQPGALTPESLKLTKKQVPVFEHLQQAIAENRADDVIDAQGVMQYQKIATALGMERGSAKSFIDGVVKKLAKKAGRTVEEMRVALRERATQQRVTTPSDHEQIGLSPARQASVLDNSELFGRESGVEQSMGEISSVGGSQSEVGVDEAPPGYVDSVEPNAKAKDDAAANRAAAIADAEEILAGRHTVTAGLDWNDAKTDEVPAFETLTLLDRAAWVEEYREQIENDDSWGAIEALQREFSHNLEPSDVEGNAGKLQDESAPETDARGTGARTESESVTDQSGAAPVQEERAAEPTNPLEARVAALRESLGERQVKALDKLVTRYADGDIDLQRLSDELENYEQQVEDAVQYSETDTVESSDAAQVASKLKKLFFSPEKFDSLVTVVQSMTDLPGEILSELSQVEKLGKVQGFVNPDGRVFLIAGNIAPGAELSVFLHEVGVHVGLEKLVGKHNALQLSRQVAKWSVKNDGSQEATLAKRAMERTRNSKSANKISEMVAYFVEEAVNAGINPTAIEKMQDGELKSWFRTLWAAAKSALRKLGLNRFEQLTAQNLVDLAYGAAKMELTGAWHGTAADFRNFDHSYMGSGEGAQAFGWGTYLAQRVGIAKGYWKDDVKRKKSTSRYKVGDTIKYGPLQGLEVLALPGMSDAATASMVKVRLFGSEQWVNPGSPEGSLMRVDSAVHDDEMIDLDKAVSKQPEQVKAALTKVKATIDPEFLDEELDRLNADWEELSGGELIMYSGQPGVLTRYAEAGGLYDNYLVELGDQRSDAKTKEAYNNGMLTLEEYAGKENFDRVNKMSPEVVVAHYLDSIGIKGIKFLDSQSRDAEQLAANAKRHLARLEESYANASANYEANPSEDNLREKTRVEKLVTTARKQAAFIPTRNLVIFNDKNIQRVMTEVGASMDKIKFSEAPAIVRDYARKVGGRSADQVVQEISRALGKLSSSVSFLYDLVDKYKGVMPSVGKWYDAVLATDATRNRLANEAETIAAAAGKLKNGTKALNAYLAESTLSQQWGYDPKFKREVVVDPDMRQKFLSLLPEERQIVMDIFARGEAMQTLLQKTLNEKGISDPLFTSAAKLAGPYAPLKRFGNHLALLKSEAYLEAEAAGDAKATAAMKSKPEHYQMHSFDTHSQAKLFAEDNAAKWFFTDAFEKSVRAKSDPVSTKLLDKVMAAVKEDSRIPASAREAMGKLMQDMYFQSVDEHNARTSGMKRVGAAGFDEDMMRSFLSHARAQAAFIASVQHGGEVNTAFYEMQNQAKNDTRHRVNQDVFNTFAEHYAENLKYVDTPWQDRVMALTSAMQLATSVGYHVANMTQPALVTVPRLAADFNNYTGAWSALIQGYRTLKETGVADIDVAGIKHAGLRAAIQKVSDAGLLNVGMLENLTQFETTTTGILAVDKASSTAKAALHALRRASQFFENMNRVASATAAYNMSRAAGKSEVDAQAYAVNIVRSTQGDSSRTNKPLLLKKLPKVMGQYRGYQFMMAAAYSKAFQQAFRDSDPDVRKIGRHMLGYKLFHAAMASGVLGLPVMSMVGMVFGALAGAGGDSKEPENLERWLREKIGDKDLAALLLHGPLSMMGLDMSAKLGEDKIFSIMRYGTFDVSSAAGLVKTAASLAGPAVSQAGKMADGVGAMASGDYYKGLEKFMPKGVESAMKAFRVANEGFTLKSGDVMFRPNDINAYALALDALGMPSAELKRMEWLRSQQYEIKRFYTDQTRELQHDYVKAYKDQDGTTMGQLREDWFALQAGKDHLRQYFGDSSKELQRQPITNLVTYPHTVAKRERKLQRSAVY